LSGYLHESVNEFIWSIGWMVLTGENWSSQRKAFLIVT